MRRGEVGVALFTARARSFHLRGGVGRRCLPPLQKRARVLAVGSLAARTPLPLSSIDNEHDEDHHHTHPRPSASTDHANDERVPTTTERCPARLLPHTTRAPTPTNADAAKRSRAGSLPGPARLARLGRRCVWFGVGRQRAPPKRPEPLCRRRATTQRALSSPPRPAPPKKCQQHIQQQQRQQRRQQHHTQDRTYRYHRTSTAAPSPAATAAAPPPAAAAAPPPPRAATAWRCR